MQYHKVKIKHFGNRKKISWKLEAHQPETTEEENDLEVLINQDEYKLSERNICKKDNCKLVLSREEFSVG